VSAQDRIRWDTYYRERKNQPLPWPSPLLLQWTPPVSEGVTQRAMDAAAGFGQNGIWLAEQGYTVDIAEISRVALARARAEMTVRNLRNVNLKQIDFDDFEINEQHYDIISVFHYLKRDMIHKLKAAIVPGGRIIYETLNIRYLEEVPEFNTDFLLDPGELVRMFEHWTILHEADEGAISQIVAVNTPPPQDTGDDDFDW
jgi:tellurite methyltransferase